MNTTLHIRTDNILFEQRNAVAIVTLNRSHALNALTPDMTQALVEILHHVDQNESIHCLILTGKGKGFSAGVDLKSLNTNPEILSPANLGPEAPFVKAMHDCRKPIIGAINGFAVTGGLEIALACDILYAVENAKFADTHAKVGLVPGWGLSQKLPRLIGINRARELSFSGRYFSASEACKWGMVNKIFLSDELMPAAIELAEEIASNQQDTLYHIKQLMNDGWESELSKGLLAEGKLSGSYNSEVSFEVMEERLASLRANAKK